MTQVTVEYEPARNKPRYWPHREALEDALLSIDMKVCVERAVARMKRQGKNKEDISAFETKFRQFTVGTSATLCPIKKIVELDTSAAHGKDGKVTGKFEYRDGLFEESSNIAESELLNSSVGRALEDAQYKMPLPTTKVVAKAGAVVEEESADEEIAEGRVMKRMTKWNLTEE
jgi:hypothetical protein